ncbi:MAG TPA: FtsX-like permease family protein, partial [Phenylobacterium sp.]
GLGVPVDPGPHWAALGLAAGAGALVAAAFSLIPLADAARSAPARLFRTLVAPVRRWPPLLALAATALCVAALCALALEIAGSPKLAFGFLAGIAALVAVLGIAALGLKRAGRGVARNPKGPRGPLRLAGANLGRPGAPSAGIVVSLGLGLTLLSALVLVAGSLSGELDRLIPKGAPAFFFIDIQPDQAAPFDALARAIPGVQGVERVPMLRGRIVAIAGHPADEARVPEGARWALRGDRGLTHAAKPPPNAEIVAGAWWPPDYSGPPLISFDANLARAFGIGVGDTLTYNVLGRDITGRIANLRRIDWSDLRLNFTGIFSPGVLDGAPHTDVATVQCDEAAEEPLLRAVGQAFPNVTAIRVRDVLGRVKALLNQVALALAGASGVSILAGILVLAGAVAAGRRARLYDAAVLHALGATRGQIVALLAVEFALLGGVAGLVAVGAGWLASWLAVTRLMDLEAAFLPGRMLAVVVLGAGVSIAFGLLGTWRALARPPAALLRSE